MLSYHALIEDILVNGESHDDRTGVGTYSVFGRQWRHQMTEGFPLLTTKFVPLRIVAEELFWFLSGSTDRSKLQEKNVTIWDEWAAPNPVDENDMGPIYGYQWRNFGRIDQIAKLLNDIENNPNSRRLMVTAWCPPDIDHMALPPCHYGFQIKCHTEQKRMSLHMTMRSTDIFLGLPFNIASYAILLEMLCRVTGYRSKDLIISFGDLHLYKNHVSQAKEQLSRKPYALPTVNVDEPFLPPDITSLERLLNMTWENIDLQNYKHHPKIKADVAV